VPPCGGGADPCVLNRFVLTGDTYITVETTRFSVWFAAVPWSPATECADVSNSGEVNVIDLFLIARQASRPYDARYDLNGDAGINVLDLFLAARQRGRACRQ
jgi:hypothetical protein